MESNALFEAMTNDKIQSLLTEYKDNASVVTLLSGIMETRKSIAEANKLKVDFEAKIAKLVKLPTPPAGIHNVYLAWAEVEEKIGEPVEVEVVKSQAVHNPDGSVNTPAVMEKVMRQPTAKVWKWVVELNHSTPCKSTSGDHSTTSTSKRAVTILKRNGLALESIGNFKTCQSACDYLKLDTKQDSAKRVLEKNNYIVESYTGSDFKA
jgi:hypothetical protein